MILIDYGDVALKAQVDAARAKWRAADDALAATRAAWLEAQEKMAAITLEIDNLKGQIERFNALEDLDTPAAEVERWLMQLPILETRQRAHAMKVRETRARYDEAARNRALAEESLDRYVREQFDAAIRPLREELRNYAKGAIRS